MQFSNVDKPTAFNLSRAWRKDAEALVKKFAGDDAELDTSEMAALRRSHPDVGDTIVASFETIRESVPHMDRVAVDFALLATTNRIHSAVDAVAGNQPLNAVAIRNLPIDLRADISAMMGATAAVTEEFSLEARLGTLKGRIQSTRGAIVGLKEELTTINDRIKGQKSKIDDLQRKKSNLQSEINRIRADHRRRRNRNMLIGFMLGGANGAVMSTAMTEMLSTKDAEIAKINREISAAEQEKSALQSAYSTFESAQGKLQGELSELEGQEKQIQSTIDGLSQGTMAPNIALSYELGSTYALEANLKRQVVVLTSMRDNAAGFSGVLDGVISGLEQQIKELEAQREAAKEALFAATVDLIMTVAGLPPTTDIAGMTVSTKALLIDADSALKDAFKKELTKSLANVPAPLRAALEKELVAKLS